jgi:hypothetical protein
MRAFACLCGLLLLAGCFGTDGGDDDGGGSAVTGGFYGALTGDVPPGCDEESPAIVHGVGGSPVAWNGPVGLPCLVGSDWDTYEPSLGLTSSGNLFLYPSFTAPNEATEQAGQFLGLGILRSMDAGASFERLHSEVAGATNFHTHTADPFMYVDPYTDRVFMEDLALPPFNCANLSFSDDEGSTWTQTVGGCMVWDHVGWGSGPPTVSDPSWPVVIQRCAITLFATTLASQASGCQKTLDGGMTWQPPGDPAFFGGPDGLPYVPSTCHGAVHHVFVDHRGWTWLGRDWCGTGPWIALSKDEGATWDHLHVDDTPMEWHDVGVGVDSAGTAYAFWISVDERPLLSVSLDDGATWSDPMDIGPPGLLTAGNANLAPGGAGKAGFGYAGTFEGMEGVHPILAAGYGLDTASPVFVSGVHPVPVNDGDCNGGLCDGQGDFTDATIAADGTLWSSYATPFLAAGRLWGAPSLWDESDPNGVYGGWSGLEAAR